MIMFQTYYDRYNELKSQYKISRTNKVVDLDENQNRYVREMTDTEQEDFDIIINYVKSHYGKTEYEIIKNKPNLSDNDLAIICDEGNLAFGYTSKHSTFYVYTD